MLFLSVEVCECVRNAIFSWVRDSARSSVELDREREMGEEVDERCAHDCCICSQAIGDASVDDCS